MNITDLSADAFNKLALDLSMKEVWRLCSVPTIRKKCTDNFYRNQLNNRFNNLDQKLDQNEPREIFKTIAEYIETHGSRYWFIQTNYNPVVNLVEGIDPCKTNDLIAEKIVPVSTKDYRGSIKNFERIWGSKTTWYDTNVSKYYAKAKGWISDSGEVSDKIYIASSKNIVYPGDKVYIALAFNEDMLNYAEIFTNLKEAQDKSIEQVERFYEIERPNFIHDYNNSGDPNLLAVIQLTQSDYHIRALKELGCWHWLNARAFKIIEVTLPILINEIEIL